MSFPNNEHIAELFRDTARLLEEQGDDPYRIEAYRRGSRLLTRLHVDVGELWERGGRDGLETLPGIGSSLAAAIEEILETGHCRTHDRLSGRVNPEDLFRKLPGIGEVLAGRIHENLHIESLEELEAAAHDGRLAGVHGVGARKAAIIADLLAQRLGRSARRAARARPDHTRHPEGEIPPLAMLLDVDRIYRDKAERGTLHLIAPHRFNPSGAAWLPVWHTHRDGWSITALFSNTARAHQLGKTRDWVVIVAEKNGHEEQFTVVTEYKGELSGLRVVRGMEEECHEHYASPLATDVAVVHDYLEKNDG
jgi:hypothetical protein